MGPFVDTGCHVSRPKILTVLTTMEVRVRDSTQPTAKAKENQAKQITQPHLLLLVIGMNNTYSYKWKRVTLKLTLCAESSFEENKRIETNSRVKALENIQLHNGARRTYSEIKESDGD